MKNFIGIFLWALPCLTVMAQTITNLNPKSVVAGKVIGGNIPAGYKNVVYAMWNGAWVSSVNLPANAKDGDKINIAIYSTWATNVNNTNTDIPQASTKLTKDTTLGFVYVAARNQWEVNATTVVGNNSNAPLQIQTSNQLITKVKLSENAWNPSVVLPASATDGAAILVSSTASQAGKIASTNLLFPYTSTLANGDKYAFVFNTKLAKWLMLQSAEKQLTLSSLVDGKDIPTPTYPVTRLTLESGSNASQVRLPATANQRDRIFIKSLADVRTTISIPSDASKGTMTIGKGETYEFMWDASSNAWHILQAPVTRLKASDYTAQSALPTPTSPTTVVEAWDGNWTSQINLPNQASTKDRVVIKSSAPTAIAVLGSGMKQESITNGEEVAFVYDAAKGWARETDTIRVLLTMGQSLVNKLGLAAAQSRQKESLRITNEALSNSGNKFRFQMAGLLTVPDFGGGLGNALHFGRSNPLIQGERNRVAADAVYYEGVEDGCGLAYVLPEPNSYSMISAGSINCGTTIMRHELGGHNMGLNHGNGFYPTAVSGSKMPYFATPNKFTTDLLPISYKAAVVDEVSIMDKNAPFIAKFK